MRITVLILSLLLGVIMFIQTVLVSGLGSMADDEGTQQSGAVGLFMSLLWLIAAAFVMPFPMVAVIAFAIAGLLGFAASGDFADLAVWGGISIVLALLSLLGWRGKRKAASAARAERVVQQERDSRLENLLTQQRAAPHPVMGITCTRCGAPNAVGTRFCGNCGNALAG